ncbi:uncharacterized protein LOC141648270 [Silene latifolia]|uniref:uncharacterized protein LOC141648270 n=1 Tax=Silene latifolia TaxID=37657 RepID=UPI003D789668
MALLCRIKETKSINLFNNFRRFYSQIHAPRLSINQTSIKPISDYYHYIRFTNAPKNLGFFDSRVRFFAAPAQYVKKEEVKEVNKTRINEEIEADVVRLVTDEGHTVVSRWEALQRAKELQLDLVEVNKNAKPPVCKIMNYSREKYKQQVKGKELAKSKAALTLKSASKEVRFSAKAEFKDVKTKVDSVKRLMDRGYRVKCTAQAADGRDMNIVLSQVTDLIKDVGFVESGPHIDEKQGYIIVRHFKFGLPKKGKKSSTVSSKVLSPTNSDDQSQSDSPVESGDYDDDVNLDNEVKDPLQYQQGISPSRSKDAKGTPKSQSPNLPPNLTPASQYQQGKSRSRSNDVMGTSKSQSPNVPPNVTPAPQPQNRYAKKGPNNAPPMRTPHFQEFPPGGHAGSEGSSSRNSGIPPLRSNDVMGTPKSQSPIFPPNVTPAPQPQNRYAKKVPNNAPPLRTPHSQGVPPVVPRQAGSESFSSRNSGPLQNPNSQHRGEIPNGARQNGNNFSPLIGNPRPPSSPRGDVPKSTSFGVFSEVKPNNGRFESGVNQKVTKEFSGRGNMNPPKFNSDGGVAGDDKKFGIFSGKK